MTFPKARETPLESLGRETALAEQQAIADYFLHPVFDRVTPDVLDDIPRLQAAGCNTIKFFTVFPWFESEIPGVLEALRRAKAHRILTMIHCEDHGIIAEATQQLLEAGKDSLRYYPKSRPVISEVIATQRAVSLSEVTRAPIYVVHLSAARALAVCREAQARGLPVYVETRPLYLHLTQELFDGPEGGKYLGQPPLREAADVEALWHGLQHGTIHTVCTDHAPWSLAAKLDPAHTLTNLRPGVANLQTQRPMLFSEGVLKGQLSLGRFVGLTATNVARLFGLYPRKGEIAVGADADLVIFDPNRTRTINKEMLHSNADYSPYEGWEVTGWPVTTLRRGEVVFHKGEILGSPGSGQLVFRGETQAL
jgi:dihydropyrimidinase